MISAGWQHSAIVTKMADNVIVLSPHLAPAASGRLRRYGEIRKQRINSVCRNTVVGAFLTKIHGPKKPETNPASHSVRANPKKAGGFSD
jgi:hypothetical protein